MKKDVIKKLQEENRNSFKYLKAIRKAYLDFSIEGYIVGDNVIFEKGANRSVSIPIEIVEEAIGMEVSLPVRRVA